MILNTPEHVMAVKILIDAEGEAFVNPEPNGVPETVELRETVENLHQELNTSPALLAVRVAVKRAMVTTN